VFYSHQSLQTSCWSCLSPFFWSTSALNQSHALSMSYARTYVERGSRNCGSRFISLYLSISSSSLHFRLPSSVDHFVLVRPSRACPHQSFGIAKASFTSSNLIRRPKPFAWRRQTHHRSARRRRAGLPAPASGPPCRTLRRGQQLARPLARAPVAAAGAHTLAACWSAT